ncbi:mannitol dehydrogenase family protein [Sulfitobacter aestuariivivens]|uniref:Mannitol dehydrogenase family protein n=1 Tax=Sulfitobacter aestuariivivens TaxID=2766981 RepID=A0A927D669_9RHOB|nr:mannitol dehydrogenase family protein [Sulfitobacter aestuariivivens]MBD3664217.1 mannitol dehydrogenase family protein [Sulfitobacter aestuariivivens]
MSTQAKSAAPVALCDATLDQLPATVARPTYDRAALTPGIVHVGLGNFHRAHQAWYLHRLMQDGRAQDWAIIGAGVRAGDAVMREKLLAQDCLTTLIELDPKNSAVEVTGAMIDFLPVEEDNRALIACMTDPRIRIVALTVTEGGYFIAPGDGGLDFDHPDIRHDIARPEAPSTVFGAIVAGLKARRNAGSGPFTVQSCDNLQGNGDITRSVVVSLARATDPDLADWIDKQGAFPNSMVDCIVPATGAKELEMVRGFGIGDAVPVTHENFRQWVIEDRFCAGRPDWDLVGATFTNDVHAYEAMKIRILNAGHQVLANAGELLSIDTIAGCMADADIAAFFDKVQRTEIAPQVGAVPGMMPLSYVDLITDRFANPRIHDTTRRVAFDGLSRHRGFVHPIIRDALAAGQSITGLALVEALWARMCAGTREDGSIIVENDPAWARLQSAALAAKADPDVWLKGTEAYGAFAADPRFRDAFVNSLSQVWQNGTRATLQSYVA